MNPPCNSCGGILDGPHEVTNQPMAELGSVWFKCRDCDQNITLMPSGRWLQVILPALYPAQMDAKTHHEFAEHEGSQKVFVSALMVSAGWRTETEHATWADDVAGAVQQYKDEHPLPKTFRQRVRELVR